MFSALRKTFAKPAFHKRIIEAKKFWYGNQGEPIQYGNHKLRYVAGTRPVRMKYIDSPDVVVRNDVRQIGFFLDNVKSGDFVLDIGGHFGQYAVLLGALVSESGRVVSFEPDPQARQTLLKNLELNNLQQRVEIEDVALFDRNGNHTFFSNGADSMSSLARSGLGENAASANVVEYQVATMRLDDYLAGRNLTNPSFAKLDTEGAEINILKGAPNLLQSNITILCELHPYAWPEFGTDFDELLQLVETAGKKIEYLDPSQRIADGEVYGAAIIS